MATKTLAPSYVHGVSTQPLIGNTIGRIFAQIARDYGEQDALLVPYQGIHWRYYDLYQHAESLAAGLVQLGLVPGDRVGFIANNSAEWVVVQYATAMAGLVLVNLNPAYQTEELAYALEHVSCRALITIESHKSSNYLQMLADLLPGLSASKPGMISESRYPELAHIIVIGDKAPAGCWRYQEICNSASEESLKKLNAIADSLQFDDVINIQFTSGTTGSPKATALTHHNIVNNAWFVGEQMKISVADRLCLPVPMYHCFGMVMGTLCALVHRASVVFPSPGYDAGAVLDVIESEKCTALYGVPTMFISQIEHPTFARHDLTSLRTGIMAGAPCPRELMLRVTSDMHLDELTIAYGMTETGPVSFQTSVDDDIEHRIGTVGQVLPHVEIKIVDENGLVVPRNTPGELLTRGYSVMPYYWNDEAKTTDAIDESHWIASGDIAQLDEDGYCTIVGRLKDMLIRGGENIFPREIEEFIYQMPGVEQVEVFGVTDARLGEAVAAWIKPEAGASVSEDAIREFCQGKIAHFKIPQYIRFVDSFPMTVTGKVQKYLMKEMMDKELKDNSKKNKGAGPSASTIEPIDLASEGS